MDTAQVGRNERSELRRMATVAPRTVCHHARASDASGAIRYAHCAQRTGSPRASGFTLIELLVTLTLLALLASVVAPFARIEAQRQQEQTLRQALGDIRSALDAYKKAADEGRITKSADQSGYPSNLQLLVDGVEDLKSPQHRKLYFLRRVPRDPFFPDPAAPAADTWGLRSYASEANDPKPGDDVYDVYSLAPGTGLDGVPYKDW